MISSRWGLKFSAGGSKTFAMAGFNPYRFWCFSAQQSVVGWYLPAIKIQAMGSLLVILDTSDELERYTALNCVFLCTGFDDPEVMAAVNDVAQNPQNFKKYKDNPKVSRVQETLSRGWTVKHVLGVRHPGKSESPMLPGFRPRIAQF